MKNSVLYSRKHRESRIAYFGRWSLLRRIRESMQRKKEQK